MTRTPHSEYPEYHTSADDLGFVRPEYLADSFGLYLNVLDVLENDECLRKPRSRRASRNSGRRGLYPTVGGRGVGDELMARLWVLNLSDGRHSLLDVADRSNLSFGDIKEAAGVLSESGVLAKAPPGGSTP